MGNHIKENNKNLITQWWFWVCLVIIILLICFTLIMINIKSGITGIAMQIQDIYPNATLYSSAGNNALILELKHLSENDINNFANIVKPIKDNVKKELSTYTKLIIMGYIDIDNVENAEVVQMTYTMPDLKEQSTQIYIDEDYLQTSITNSLTDIFDY